MHFEYQPEIVCSQSISFDIIDNKVYNLAFVGGCNGNLKAISRLLDGASVNDVISKLEGITCGRRPTSCSDQLTKALRKAVEQIG